MVEDLLDSGRVIDESERAAPTAPGSSRSRDLDTVPRMNLNVTSIPRQRRAPFKRASEDATIPGPQASADVTAAVRERLTLAWQSNPLSRRDLTIPTGPTTNRTGSMLFSKGALEDIDQRHYFRDEVFAGLHWQFDTAARSRYMERTEARFQLVIRDVSYGIFTLRLSHNSRTDTRTYEQSNSMTQLHWGEARPFIARADLLDRTMYLYRDSVDNGLFMLEID